MIADYTDLAVHVSEYSGRDDFMQMFPRFLSFAEIKLSRELRVSGMETTSTVTTDVAGSASLPTRYVEMREFKDSTGRILEGTSVPGADWLHGPYSGTPQTYYIKGGSIYVVPYAAADFTASYYASIPPMAYDALSGRTTNWLLDAAPMVYLYSIVAEVIGWAVATGRETDPARLQAVSALRRAEIDQYQMQDNRIRFSNSNIVSRGINP